MNRRWLEDRTIWALGCAAVGASAFVACAASTNSGGAFDQGGSTPGPEDAAAPPASDAAAVSPSGSSSGSSGSSSGGTGGGTDASSDKQQADATATIGGDSGGLLGAGDAGSCPAPSGITSQQQTALQIVNSTRAAMGSPCATMVPTLNTSATKHCQYYAANTSNMMCIANPHVEVSGCTDYVAAQFNDRETAAGYKCTGGGGCASSEVMAFDDNPTYALAQWIGSIYHRTPTLDPWTRDFGYGNATMCDTIDFGEGAGSMTPANVIVSYPYDGQTGVGLSFNGAQESPTPPMPPNGWPSAMPITIYMQATNIMLTTDEFGVDGGSQLPHQVMTPQSAMGYLTNALVLYGNAPLKSQTKYRVHVAGTRMTQSFFGNATSAMFDVSFAFTTM